MTFPFLPTKDEEGTKQDRWLHARNPARPPAPVHEEICFVSFVYFVGAICSRSHPGRLVVMPSTPAAASWPAFAGESTVQTYTFKPAALSCSTSAEFTGPRASKSR